MSDSLRETLGLEPGRHGTIVFGVGEVSVMYFPDDKPQTTENGVRILPRAVRPAFTDPLPGRTIDQAATTMPIVEVAIPEEPVA